MKYRLVNILILIALLGVVGCSDLSSTGDVLKADYEYGVFSVDIVSSEYRDDHISEKRSFVDNEINLKKTRSIPAIKGLVFGLKYKMPKHVIGKEISVRQVVKFPESGLINPKTEKLAYQAEVDDVIFIDMEEDLVDSLFYKFSEQWEIKPGQWKFEVYIDGVEYIEETFNVYIES